MLRIVRWAATSAVAIMLASHFGFTTPQALSANVTNLLGTAEQSTAQAAPDPKGANPVEVNPDTGREVLVRTCTVNINVPPGTDREFVELLTEAGNKYNQATPFTVNVSVGSGDIPVIFKTDTSGRAAATAHGQANDTTNVYTPTHLEVYTEVDFPLSRTERIHNYMHEIGHFFGLGHSPIPNTIMYQFTNHSTELTKYELKTLNKLAKGC